MVIKPENMLTNSLDKTIVLGLRDGSVYRGTLKGFDEYENIILSDVIRIKPENKGSEGVKEAVFKGGNVVYIFRQ
ncbi:MAG TPA: RNA-binding protein [Euryarchaeota archaeon]|nr:small nuclear ribonucleoprotein [archaeon BMS3Bbin15]HDL15866.1 RNA-binding protein [Euryarchaeota archaeon]